ncbi:MAG: GspH/FimT family pseudopilin [Woeseiaceae bacterium]
MRERHANRGYSLLELLMTLGLLTIVLTLGVPSFGNILSNQRLMSQTNALFHDVHLARKESVVRRRVVSLCPTVDGDICDTSFDWSAGWMMFVNLDRDWPAVRDRNEPVLKQYQATASVRIMSNRRSFSLRSTELRATNGTVVFCDRKGRGTARALIISYTGRPRVAYKTRRGKGYQCAD